MRVAVLGAGGTIAPAIVRDLAESDEVEQIELFDLRADVAERVALEHGGGKATARRLDAREDLAGALESAEVLVNSASYRLNIVAMEAALAAGCHYLDLGGLYRMTGEQLALHGRFEEAGLLALLGIGSSPGKTNLMASRAVAELGGRAERIDVFAAGRDLDPPPGFSVPYALQTLIDELTLAPVVLRDGRPTELEPLSEGGEADFGSPIGVGATIYTLHSELRTFGESFGCRECSFRLSLPPNLLERLRQLVGATEETVRAAGRDARPPSPETVSAHVVEASLGARRARMRAVTRPHRGWGLGGGIVSTASPAAAAVRLLARGSVSARGVLPPERCLDPAQVFAELEQRGCRFVLEVEEGVAA
jgi:saccharopine dehydrogenase (NAD+, L-lysine-forming)